MPHIVVEKIFINPAAFHGLFCREKLNISSNGRVTRKSKHCEFHVHNLPINVLDVPIFIAGFTDHIQLDTILGSRKKMCLILDY